MRVLEAEGVTVAFGVPGAAVNPLYAALKGRGPIRHILARHVEGASHMADGYTRARAGTITAEIESDETLHGPLPVYGPPRPAGRRSAPSTC